MPRKRKQTVLASGAIARGVTESDSVARLNSDWLPACDFCGQKFASGGNRAGSRGRRARYCSAACRKAKSRAAKKCDGVFRDNAG
jgi:hypothetical protein